MYNMAFVASFQQNASRPDQFPIPIQPLSAQLCICRQFSESQHTPLQLSAKKEAMAKMAPNQSEPAPAVDYGGATPFHHEPILCRAGRFAKNGFALWRWRV